jgi:hypothetical protein
MHGEQRRILKKAVVDYVKILPQHLPHQTAENDNKPQSGHPAAWP